MDRFTAWAEMLRLFLDTCKIFKTYQEYMVKEKSSYLCAIKLKKVRL